MKRLFLLFLLLPASLAAQQYDYDWANYGRYAKANAELEQTPSVVFMGNSITDFWFGIHPIFFTTNNYACRGIGGQVTAQMLSRFRSDVIELHPLAVVILAGTNDLARNNGLISSQHIVQNIISMAELAAAADIRPIICSVLPVKSYPWRPELGNVSQKIRNLNAQLKLYAAERGFAWVDYYSALVDDEGGMKAEYTTDGVHVTPEGYTVMERVLAPVLAEFN